MKNTAYKYLPIVFGLAVGWLIFHPPQFLEALGPARLAVHATLIALLILSSVPLIALANLPEQVRMRPLESAGVPPELAKLRDQFHALGFRDTGPPLRVEIAPAATLLGFVHEREPVYGTAFRTDTVPPRVSYDLVSILDGERGGLTTNADPQGAALPAAAGMFRQVLPKANPTVLFHAHLEGIRYLRDRGVGVRPVSADAFQLDLQKALARQREAFLASPLRGSLLLFWRAATKQVPFLGRLREQRIAAEQLQALATGGSRAF
jgi:hypothetical protein